MPATGVFVVGCIVLFIGVLLASSGGVGGGGIFVPILLAIFKYGFSTSVAYSCYMVLGNQLAQFLINLRLRHPYKRQSPMINWELVTILSPAQLIGGNLGSILAEIVPDSSLFTLAFIVISFALIMAVKKGVHRFQEETKRNEMLHKCPDPPKLFYDDGISDLTDSFITSTPSSHTRDTTVIIPIELPWNNVIFTSVTYFLYIAFTIALALQTTCSASWSVLFVLMYIPFFMLMLWGIHHLQQVEDIEAMKPLPSILTTTAISSDRIKTSDMATIGLGISPPPSTIINPIQAKGKTISGMNIDPEGYVDMDAVVVGGADEEGKAGRDSAQLKPTPPASIGRLTINSRHTGTRQTLEDFPVDTPLAEMTIEQLALGTDTIEVADLTLLPLLVVFIGLVCSLLGIGGAELLNPTLLNYQILPQIITATTSTMGVITMSVTVIHLLIIDTHSFYAGIIFLFIGFFGGLIGRRVSLFLAQRNGRGSILIFTLAIVLLLSALFYIYQMSRSDYSTGLGVFC
jgi:uncharacterized membrane protein YfcA